MSSEERAKDLTEVLFPNLPRRPHAHREIVAALRAERLAALEEAEAQSKREWKLSA